MIGYINQNILGLAWGIIFQETDQLVEDFIWDLGSLQ